jgi:Tfp pilus assembly protein PilP
MTRHHLLALVFLVACGDDDEGAGGQRANAPTPAAAAAAAAAKPGSKDKLQPREHIEDKISCPVPEAPTGHPACTPPDQVTAPGAPPSKMLPDCDPGSYCMQVAQTWSCEPCPERESIRHDFKERDFVEDQARDPFQSYVISQPGLTAGSNVPRPEPHQSCKRADQFVASDYSYQDLKLAGIVAQGTQRKVLMQDTRNHGHIIKRGDCVGKEKAVVKDIGAGYVTFVVDEDPDTKRPAIETSIQLHPNSLELEDTEVSPGPTPGAPTPAGPAAPAVPGAPAPAPRTPISR